MTYCQRCGELNRSDKLTTTSSKSSSSMSALRAPKIDRWQSSYLGSFMNLDSILSLPPNTVDDNTSTITNTTTTTPSSPASSTTSSSSLLNRYRRTTLSSLWDTNKRVAPSSRPPKATITNPPPPPISTTASKEARKKICPECNKSLSGKIVRLPDSSTRYHWACLRCTHCHEPFENTSFYIDSMNHIYHPKCSPMVMNKSCSRCSTEINDAYIVIHNKPLHPKCFRCSVCHKALQPSSIYTDTKTAVYCQPCSNKKVQQFSTRQTKIVPQLHPPPQPCLSLPITDSMDRLSLAPSSISGGSQLSSSIASSFGLPITTNNNNNTASNVIPPSLLMSRRGKPLPKFGMRKVCAGCTQTIISVHEEKPGPRATRWHKKCLACSRCSKVLDSAAVVHENATTGGLEPWCTMCLLVKKKEDANSYSYTSLNHTSSTTYTTINNKTTAACGE
ncbi:hypothetical protein BDA99DRAFT_571893 [Phascolomyces articulosus]|uniref:LIM zinc-binding domain-containing protein n=1 Tax=Phascolomyces articulosus TaxID=60185 RepID=A0AAD5PDN7_9FUNG|nr:hypothetical protein BDA99DRAFT_571893 [Phascolomyces articulosus]